LRQVAVTDQAVTDPTVTDPTVTDPVVNEARVPRSTTVDRSAPPVLSGVTARTPSGAIGPMPPGANGRKAVAERLLRSRNFQLFWFGETISRFGSAVTTVALPLVAVTTLHASVFAVGLLEAATWLPWVLIGLPAGAWVDRFARRPVMVACNVASAVLFGTVPVAAWWGLLGIGQLLAVAFCAGIARVFFRTAFQAYLPVVVPKDDLAEGNAKLQGSSSAAEIAGPGLAGLMAQAFGAVTAVFADAVSFVISVACLLSIDAREARSTDPRRNAGLFRRIAEGLRYVLTDPYLRAITLLGGLGNLTVVAVQTILVVFLIRVVGVGTGLTGLLMAGFGVGGVLGALVARRVIRRLGTARALLYSQLVAAPFGLLLPLAAPGFRLALFFAGAAVLAVGVVVGSIIGSSFRQAYCPPHLLGRVSAVVSFLVFGAMPVGALLGGGLAAALGIRPALWILAGALILPALVPVLSPIRGRHDLPTAR
jgi:MFS family permease